jgi:hypothetical protein
MKRHTQLAAMAAYVSLAGGMVTAAPMPKDLQDLADKWSHLQKKEGAETRLRMQFYENGEDSARQGTLIFESESARTREAGGNISLSAFDTLTEDVQHTIFTKIFPSKQPAPILCEALQLKPYSPKKSGALTPLELQKAEAMHYTRACKESMQDTLAGILHGDPKTFVYEVHSDTGSEVVAYVQSMIDATTYLRYQFQVR